MPEWTLVSGQFAAAFARGEAGSFNLSEAVDVAHTQMTNLGLPASYANDNPHITEDCLFLDVVVPSAVFKGGASGSTGGNSSLAGSRASARNGNKGAPVLVWYGIHTHLCPFLQRYQC